MMFIIVEIGNLCDTVSFLKTGTAVFTRRAFSSDPEEEDKLRIDRQQPWRPSGWPIANISPLIERTAARAQYIISEFDWKLKPL